MPRTYTGQTERRFTLEDCVAAVDIRAWRREGKLAPGIRFITEFKRGTEIVAMLGVLVRASDAAFLLHRLDAPFDKLPASEQTVRTVVEPNQVYPRVYFVCPDCEERHVSKLYCHPSEVRFSCQQCTGLRPKIDYLSSKERKNLQLERINRELATLDWIPASQVKQLRSMRRKTFDRLLAQRAALQSAGVIENQTLVEKLNSERAKRDLEQEKRDPRIKGGVLYFD